MAVMDSWRWRVRGTAHERTVTVYDDGCWKDPGNWRALLFFTCTDGTTKYRYVCQRTCAAVRTLLEVAEYELAEQLADRNGSGQSPSSKRCGHEGC